MYGRRQINVTLAFLVVSVPFSNRPSKVSTCCATSKLNYQQQKTKEEKVVDECTTRKNFHPSADAHFQFDFIVDDDLKGEVNVVHFVMSIMFSSLQETSLGFRHSYFLVNNIVK